MFFIRLKSSLETLWALTLGLAAAVADSAAGVEELRRAAPTAFAGDSDVQLFWWILSLHVIMSMDTVAKAGGESVFNHDPLLHAGGELGVVDVMSISINRQV